MRVALLRFSFTWFYLRNAKCKKKHNHACSVLCTSPSISLIFSMQPSLVERDASAAECGMCPPNHDRVAATAKYEIVIIIIRARCAGRYVGGGAYVGIVACYATPWRLHPAVPVLHNPYNRRFRLIARRVRRERRPEISSQTSSSAAAARQRLLVRGA